MPYRFLPFCYINSLIIFILARLFRLTVFGKVLHLLKLNLSCFSLKFDIFFFMIDRIFFKNSFVLQEYVLLGNWYLSLLNYEFNTRLFLC